MSSLLNDKFSQIALSAKTPDCQTTSLLDSLDTQSPTPYCYGMCGMCHTETEGQKMQKKDRETEVVH